MKHFLLVCTFITMHLANAQTTGELVFFSNLGEKFYVVVNGIQQNQKPESNIKIEGLLEGWYSCRVVSENNLFSLEQNVGVLNNKVITYRIINKKGSHKLRYFTEVAMNTYTNPQGISTVVYHTEPYTQTTQTTTTQTTTTQKAPTQTTQTTTTQTTGTSGTTTQQVNTNTGGSGISTQTQVTEPGMGGVNETINVNIGISETGMNTQIIDTEMNENIQMNVGINTTGMNTTNTGVNQTGTVNNSQSETVTTTTTTTTNGVTVVAENTTPTTSTSTLNTTNCLVDNAGMEKALTMVKNESFADDKMRVAKQFAKNKCLTVNQVSQFGKLFSFADDKMDFVKFAHANCMNKQDYYELMEIFTFSDDKEELENFLNSRQ